MTDSIENRDIEVHCADDLALAATLFRAPSARGPVVLIAPAAAVPARFYARFATYLAEQGFEVLTWDWRGIGRNAPASPRASRATMSDWATLDLPAMIDWASAWRDAPVIGIGHSFGGQAFGLAGRSSRFERVVLLASQSGYWGHWPSPGRYLFRAAIAVLSLLTRVVGYLPAKRLGLGENMPAGVALEWFSWCRAADYLGDYRGHAALEVPVYSLGFRDDGFAPVAARRWLLDRYGGDAKTFETIDPAAESLPAIGHLLYFRPERGGPLWPRLVTWLRNDRDAAPAAPPIER